jgi:hypothetical protein
VYGPLKSCPDTKREFSCSLAAICKIRYFWVFWGIGRSAEGRGILLVVSEVAGGQIRASLAAQGFRVALVEKDQSVCPLGRPREAGPGLVLRLRNAMFPSSVPLWPRLSPLFCQDAQIFIFPAPINSLGD